MTRLLTQWSRLSDLLGSSARAHKERWALAALLAVHLLLGVYYSVAIPVWEAHDEVGHYYYVRYLATEHRLPPPGERLLPEGPLSVHDESRQPPLYYILAALPVALVDVDDGFEPHVNPYMSLPQAEGGHNRVIHDPAAEGWPYRGTVLAIHLARWVSVLLGGLGLAFTFLAGRGLAPGQPWVRWGAVLILGFWPQFRFSTAVINNDIALTASAAGVAWLLVRVALHAELRVWDVLALGAAAGLAVLSKAHGLALLPAVLVVLLGRLAAIDGQARRRLLAGLLGSAVLAAIVTGWWLMQNVQGGSGILGGYRSVKWLRWLLGRSLFGEGGVHWDLVLPNLRHSLFSLWAGLGCDNYGLPIPYYWVAAFWSGLGVSGLVLWAAGRPPWGQRAGVAALLLLIALAIGLPLGVTVLEGHRNLMGRILLPALPAMCILLAVGWDALLPGRIRAVGWVAMGGALGLFALLMPGLYIRPAYAHPPKLAEAQVAEYTAVRATFGGFAELVGYRIEDPFLDPSDTLRLTLVWRVLARTQEDYTLRIKVAGPHFAMAETRRYPGQGAFATTTWEPGHVFAEQMVIPLESDIAHPYLASIEVRFCGGGDGDCAPVLDGDGQHLGSRLQLARIKVRGTSRSGAATDVGGFQFGPAIRLVGSQVRTGAAGGHNRLEAELTWAAVARPETDYTVSVQLRDGHDSIITQFDSQPQGGAYPTSFWEAGEMIGEQYVLPLPPDLVPGMYTLYACLYDAASRQRLPALDPQGQPLANAEVPLATLKAESDS